MRTCRILAAAIAVVACVVPTIAAQTPATAFVGQRVVDVQIVAEGRPVDDPMIMGLALLGTLLISVTYLVSDLLYLVADPRIRYV